ncbi:flagellar basal body rod protein FlgB [Paracraurococcus ruber]|uniref:Flagellar biosynthesis protein FlgB n=1 Tax=Paracraurococcus ruber TaxID=77675 RepID=A0ABS1D5A8_9PROT|nr:flagellar basal body protein [Paracraurococcus ruber]MBK1661741.1 flagellar biosynthesis protein FlgB [Paracraurococcus ruber]TDG17932.1 flagellar biosynthesis protein FlgB [Paracraurococcus ruber]
MDPSHSAPVALAERRLAWLDARQRVLSQNIANADTPGYRPRDLSDFSRLVMQRAGPAVAMARTDDQHLAPARDPRARPDRAAVEASPNGNRVSLDREALKVADTDNAHALAIGLHRRWLGMFRTALGRTQ